MAQPIAQHPPSALQFPSASRTSSLGFGFASPGTRSPFAPVGNANFGTTFGSPNAFASSSAQTGLVFKPNKARPPLPTFHSVPRAQKRSRLSTSPSPPRRSPGGSSPSSPSASPTRVKEILAVNDLALGSTRPRTTKRLRQAPTETAAVSDDLDLGVMLATLPPSTHLQILNSLISKDPSLRAKVLNVIPAPDLQLCNDELYRIMDRISRQYGEPGPGRYLLSWTRAEGEIAVFAHTALTYLSFFSSQHHSASIGSSTQHNLLYTTTRYAATLIRLIPPLVTQSSATASLSQLVNTLITRWRAWVETVSQDVNQKGEIYPLSTVSTWAANIGELADPRRSESASQTCPDPAPTAEFEATMCGIREEFLRQVGWLIGPNAGSR